MDDAAASWTDAEQIFFKEDVEADIFLIMDCSYASDMMRSTEDNGRAFLLLAACNIGKTTPSPGPHSFTSSLITVLTELADEYRERESTTWDLIERLKKARIEYKNSTPEVYRKLAGNRHIGLR